MLELSNVTVRYGRLTVADNVSFSVRPGDWIMLAGPNGAGKSTLVSAISQGAPYAGSIRFSGADVSRMTAKNRARCFGVLTQTHSVSYAFTVEEIVRLGRYAYRGALGAPGEGDEAAVEAALLDTGMAKLRAQSVLTLSGGELQRAFLAQLFAQDPRLLILDEPTNHLDLLFQKQIFALIRSWIAARPDRAVLSVVHDLSLARAYGTGAVLLDRGRVIAAGAVDTVFSPANLDGVYGMDVCGWMRELLMQWQETEHAT